ncbi:MAG TPA: ROK family protein [Solirubrobacterales bacterium]|jgi:glucokinase|nr:ROK family protein [Solirubrobacterales bacterium]
MAELRGGIDLGGTKIQTAIVDAGGKVSGEARHPTPTEGGPQDVAEAMATAMREAAADAGVETSELAGVGVGSPGDADEKTGVVSAARNLPGWEGSFPLAETLKDALGTEVRIGNDVQVATEAEFQLGAGREFESLIGVFWGTGVGGGLILDGKPWLGRGAAAEIGHMVVKRGGAKCPCGREGCLEAYAGRKALEAEARKRHDDGEKTDLFKLMEKHEKPRLTSGIWERALDHEDKLAEELIERAVEALGTGIASAINLLDVEAVILGGGLGIRFGERLMEPLMEEMDKHLFVNERPPTVRVASLGDLGGAIGASLLVSR